jgi:Hemingway/CFA97
MRVSIQCVNVCVGRFTEIEKANRILLERMTHIMQGSGSTTAAAANRTLYNSTPASSGLVMHKRSLNSEVRKKELMKITIENQHILRRLQEKTSNYSVQRWEEDFRETEKRMKSMCEYPFALFTDPSGGAKYRTADEYSSANQTAEVGGGSQERLDTGLLSRGGMLPRIGTGVSGQRSAHKSYSTINA